jgi:hypothetical protein
MSQPAVNVWDRLVGQEEALAVLQPAARAAADLVRDRPWRPG